MKFKHITFIINPASGKQEPILSVINQAMENVEAEWEVAITKKDRGAGEIAVELIGKTDLVVVYGGDGCVTEVAAVLQGQLLPMAILPGGTANVMAKELGIPTDTAEALALLTAEKHQFISADMGMMNDQPFLLRVNIGIMADMILQADRELKDNLGQLAYGLTAIKTLSDAEPISYQLEIDGKVFLESGVSLTVTNSGHMGVGDFALQPGISITDGMLDVILMRDADLLSILKIAGSTLLQHESEALLHWKCKHINIRMDQAKRFICDDREEKAQQLNISVLPGSHPNPGPIIKFINHVC